MARNYLKEIGYAILEMNFRFKMGEIDLIAQDGQTVCFIEVKTRKSLAQGSPFEAVHAWKVRKLSRMAVLYLKLKYRSLEIPSRFDVIAITYGRDGAPRIEHLKNAFDSAF